MERVGILINKLLQQYNDKVTAENIAITAQMLVAELQLQNNEKEQKSYKAAVIMPGNRSVSVNIESPAVEIQPVAKAAEVEQKQEEVVVENAILDVYETNREQGKTAAVEEEIFPKGESFYKPAEEITEEPKQEEAIPDTHALDVNEANRDEVETPPTEDKKLDNFYSRFMPYDIPTLPIKSQPKEVHELKLEASDDEELSLNDKLKEIRKETADVISGEPIKDLRKAININDRYSFINELFRGDEAMYDRSIKVINDFKIFAEADYWIQRELKTKLGWIESDVTKQFDNLVRRRFA